MFEIPPNTLPPDAVRLCLGSGSNPLKDFVNLDFFSEQPEVIICDLRRLPYKDNSELHAIVEQKESVIKSHIDMVNERIAENAKLATENEKLKSLLDARQDAQRDRIPFKTLRSFIARRTKGMDTTRT